MFSIQYEIPLKIRIVLRHSLKLLNGTDEYAQENAKHQFIDFLPPRKSILCYATLFPLTI